MVVSDDPFPVGIQVIERNEAEAHALLKSTLQIHYIDLKQFGDISKHILFMKI